MHFSIALLTLLTTTSSASYVVQDDYSSSSFADMFDFYTDDDPTNGYVNYVSYSTAESEGLYKIQDGAVYMGVDSTNTASGRGRDSIRIASKNTYEHGLVVLDLAHMPAGACGTWPAFWMLGEDWPNNGEIDIIEGVNDQSANNMAMHTSDGCTITNTGAFSGTLETDNCYVQAADQSSNAGCSIRSTDDSSFGSGFNSAGGGVFATEWTSEAISIWFFSRDAIPSDITSGSPDPSGWGLPQGQFTGGCDIDDKVKNQQLVFDVTFCGDWAGDVWSTDTACSAKASTCSAYVQNNPSAFEDTYWLINSLKVYTDNGASSTAAATTSAKSSAAATTAAETSAAATTAVATASATGDLSTITGATTATTFITYTSAESSDAATTTAAAATTTNVVVTETTSVDTAEATSAAATSDPATAEATSAAVTTAVATTAAAATTIQTSAAAAATTAAGSDSSSWSSSNGHSGWSGHSGSSGRGGHSGSGWRRFFS
ncbi:concanavalin A-like lectin/glucanase domain-containing protein [Exophiala viscosa]|uniref:endo-1,3(4)-beta-glucanase n=1 Tax=Exophiala viscosa TaxID=2486360 RepID=A0AAN6E1T6_9EURO|nr:concanavalin A-like lectin/glucanase domain-containing protein [Exophiala viscosa]KAI1621773.1 concanavalin A-like lectin/glucanase domain-containing protein [Exophiala viscosa]